MKKLFTVLISSLLFLGVNLSYAERSGEEIYSASCITCHAPGPMAEALGAPAAHDEAAWKKEFDEHGGIDGLLEIVKTGEGAMPPMGACNDCSDDELKAAIEFMMNK